MSTTTEPAGPDETTAGAHPTAATMPEPSTAPEPVADDNGPQSPQEAADAALRRANQPPAFIQKDGPPAATHQPVSDDEPGPEPLKAQTGLERMAELASAERPDVQVDDPYVESRDALATGSADEADLETITEWLLSDQTEVNTRRLRIRLGGSDEQPLFAAWFIQAIGIDTIRSAEREAAGANRAQRRGQQQQYDELKANLRIVAVGTAAVGAPNGPTLVALAQQKGLRDPVTLIEQKFVKRPGLIAQIAGEIMALSGFDADDVRAAGN